MLPHALTILEMQKYYQIEHTIIHKIVETDL